MTSGAGIVGTAAARCGSSGEPVSAKIPDPANPLAMRTNVAFVTMARAPRPSTIFIFIRDHARNRADPLQGLPVRRVFATAQSYNRAGRKSTRLFTIDAARARAFMNGSSGSSTPDQESSGLPGGNSCRESAAVRRHPSRPSAPFPDLMGQGCSERQSLHSFVGGTAGGQIAWPRTRPFRGNIVIT